MPQVFFKHFTSKSQPPGLSRSGTLVENRLNSNIVRIARMAAAVYLRSCHITLRELYCKKKKKKKKKKKIRSSRPQVFCKKGVLGIILRKNTCAREYLPFYIILALFIKTFTANFPIEPEN